LLVGKIPLKTEASNKKIMATINQNQNQTQDQDQSQLIDAGKLVITTLIIGTVVTTTGAASIPIGVGAVIIGEGTKYIADVYDNKPLEFVGEILSGVGATLTLNGITGRWKASKQ